MRCVSLELPAQRVAPTQLLLSMHTRFWSLPVVPAVTTMPATDSHFISYSGPFTEDPRDLSTGSDASTTHLFKLRVEGSGMRLPPVHLSTLGLYLDVRRGARHLQL